MYKGLTLALVVPVWDEEKKIGEVVRRAPRDVVDEVLVVDDGSKDRSAEVARQHGATVLPLGRTVGVGAALREGFRWVHSRGFDVVVVCAGNNKDFPERSHDCSIRSRTARILCRARGLPKAEDREACRSTGR